MTTDSGRSEFEGLARQLEESGDYRVLRRFVPPGRYAESDSLPHGTAIALDIETTGLDPRTDIIIQVSVVAFEYSAETGRIFEVSTPVTYFENPGRSIPPDVVKMTGITDADVAGKRIDDQAVAALVRAGGLVVAHNAVFDRPFLERRLPVFQDVPWACSMAEVPWRNLGYASLAEEYLLLKHCGLFYDAHRADRDALAMIHLLATPFESGELPFRLLLQSARLRTLRIWAVGAPFDAKDTLKVRGYRWNPGDDGRPKAWHRDVSEEDQTAELAWLREQVYGGRNGPWHLESFDARKRYSARIGL
ncbi:MAG: 3'-5' exonuclease [Gemmatimonadales bacterium]|jgi:DNA polymerase-3 subunit epsilon